MKKPKKNIDVSEFDIPIEVLDNPQLSSTTKYLFVQQAAAYTDRHNKSLQDLKDWFADQTEKLSNRKLWAFGVIMTGLFAIEWGILFTTLLDVISNRVDKSQSQIEEKLAAGEFKDSFDNAWFKRIKGLEKENEELKVQISKLKQQTTVGQR